MTVYSIWEQATPPSVQTGSATGTFGVIFTLSQPAALTGIWVTARTRTAPCLPRSASGIPRRGHWFPVLTIPRLPGREPSGPAG